MNRQPRKIFLTLWRCLRLKCPACGRASIIERPLTIKSRCTSCPTIFKREEGFFVGAIMANVVATEVLILIIYFTLLLVTDLGERARLIIAFAVGISFP